MKRIFGLESEYRIVEKEEQKILGNTPKYVQIIKDDPEIVCQFILNGARLYLDRDLVEYATPECATIRDLLVYDRAGDRIVLKKIGRVAQILKSSRNDDSTSGAHENYSILPQFLWEYASEFWYLVKCLVPFLVSRQILCGAGNIERIGGRFEYHISQRAAFITQVTGDCTTAQRAIINTKKAGRLHLILGDANLADVSTFLKFGTTDIVLQMIEARFLKKVPSLQKPVRAIWKISSDPKCKKTVRLSNKKRFTAINLQEWYYNQARIFFKQVARPTKEQKIVMIEWEDKLRKLSADPELCGTELDWCIKQKLIRTYQAKRGLSLGSKEVRNLAWLYHLLNPELGIYYKLLNQGKIRRLVIDAEISRAEKNPPSNTRAKLRAKLIKTILKHPRVKQVIFIDWNQIACVGFLRRRALDKTISLKPLETKNQQLEKLIESIKEID